jgi:sterol 3beta-glucosyltransferase
VHVTILTVGSRGDVQPYLALAGGLRQAGYQVRVATHQPFQTEIHQRGLEFRPVEGNPRQLLESEAGLAWLEAGRNPLAGTRRLIELARPHVARLLADAVAACRDTDAIIYAPLGMAGYHLAQQQRVPSILAALVPLTPTRAFPAAGAPPWPLGGAYHLATHLIAEQLGWQPFRRQLNQWRRQTLGLAPVGLLGPGRHQRRHREPVLYGYSPSVLPKPPDWASHLQVTGYWFPDPDPAWQPPPVLARFLQAGPPPVYVGFGSMTDRDPAGLARTAVAALRRAGCRGVLARGWAALTGATDHEDLLVVDEVPHDWLFPRMAAVVHHGGAGTTHTGLRAGIPNVVVPFFTDQPFWAQRVADLGAGPPPIPRQMLTVDRLAAAIHTAVSDPTLQARAAALGRRIEAEDGVTCAVQAVQKHLALTQQASEATEVVPNQGRAPAPSQGSEGGDRDGQR